MSGVLAAPTVFGLLQEGRAALQGAGVPTARQDAEWLLATVLGTERLRLQLAPRREIGPPEAARYRGLLERRARHEPLQHLLGFEDFRGVRLRVTPDVLVPRPETEGLVDWAVAILRERPRARVADVGTGSGAIAAALAAGLPGVEVLALERSLPALRVAAENVRALGLEGRVRLIAADLLGPLGRRGPGLDMVIANPPYVPTEGFASLPREVRDFEPRAALDGGPGGMAITRRIVLDAPAVLAPGGWLLLEIGEAQAGTLAALMAAQGFTGIRARRDLRGVERYLGGQWPETPAPRAGC